MGNDNLGSTVEHRPVGRPRSTVTWRNSSSRFFQANPIPQNQSRQFGETRSSRGCCWCVARRTKFFPIDPGRPVSREEQHVQDHDNSGKPEREEAQHTVQENHHLERRDTVDQFDLATDDTNIDFSVSGIPEETVKRSETMNILELIRRITRHPQKQSRPERSRPETVVQRIQCCVEEGNQGIRQH